MDEKEDKTNDKTKDELLEEVKKLRQEGEKDFTKLKGLLSFPELG